MRLNRLDGQDPRLMGEGTEKSAINKAIGLSEKEYYENDLKLPPEVLNGMMYKQRLGMRGAE